MTSPLVETAPATACRSCGSKIKWVRTETGKAMPVDAEPVPDGNLILVTGRGSVEAHVVGPDAPHGRPLHRWHWETCSRIQNGVRP